MTAVGGATGSVYHYSYTQAGRVTAQRTSIRRNAYALNLDAAYTWDNEGR
ncbi:MAG: hypothetical protein JO336_10160 [Acidobacteriia bacterium]|nr:hypothetical protein [Terriglobia bacterium]MBV8904260.1 hypothetical protein [Terriglobia bacterium]